MKKYFTHNEGGEKGPFDIEELKSQNLKGDSMIWFDGLESWKRASEIEELKGILKPTPPPLTKSAPPSIETQKRSQNTSLKRNSLIGAGVLCISFIIYFLFNQYITQQNLRHEVEEQKIKINQQEEIENLRVEKENAKRAQELREMKMAELDSLKYTLERTVVELDVANTKLEDIKKFKFLRTQEEKDLQIESQSIYIHELEEQIEDLKSKIKNHR